MAIHEAMEQQTISITKAGIQATLNARTSILAAANPVFGRYDRSKPLKANVAVSAPIMSRFDLFFIIVDESNPELDEAIARHIIAVHKPGGKRAAADAAPFSSDSMQKYIRYARTLNPRFSPESQRKVVECYRLLRQQDILGSHKAAYRITVRQLESLVRLSEALARLHLDPVVKEVYVLEALRLLQKSIIFVETTDVALDDNEEQMGASNEKSEQDDASDGPDDFHEGQDDFPGAGDSQPTERSAPTDLGKRSSLNAPERFTESSKKVRRTSKDGGGKAEKKPKLNVSNERYREVTQILLLILKKMVSNCLNYINPNSVLLVSVGDG